MPLWLIFCKKNVFLLNISHILDIEILIWNPDILKQHSTYLFPANTAPWRALTDKIMFSLRHHYSALFTGYFSWPLCRPGNNKPSKDFHPIYRFDENCHVCISRCDFFVHPESVNHYSAHHFTWKISLWAFSYSTSTQLFPLKLLATLFTGNTLIFGVKWIFSHHSIFTFPFWLVYYLDDLAAAPLFVFENGHLKA